MADRPKQVKTLAAAVIAIGLVAAMPGTLEFAELFAEPLGLDVDPGEWVMSPLLTVSIILAAAGAGVLWSVEGSRTRGAVCLFPIGLALAAGWFALTKEGLAALPSLILHQAALLVAVILAVWALGATPDGLDPHRARQAFYTCLTIVAVAVAAGVIAGLADASGPRFTTELVVQNTIFFGVFLAQLLAAGLALAYAKAEIASDAPA
jgi:hypothetical protein